MPDGRSTTPFSSVPPRREVATDGVDVMKADGELETRGGVTTGNQGGVDELVGRWGYEQVDADVLEVKDRGVFVLVRNRQVEDVLVERLRAVQVLHEQGDGADTLRPLGHCGLLHFGSTG